MSLRLSDVRFSYSDATFELSVPSLEVSAGERVALVGPSGSGKSTLLALMAGLVVPRAGVVETLGLRLSDQPEKERREQRLRLGLVFQEQELVAHLGILDNVLLPLYLTAPRVASAARPRAEFLLEQLGLNPRLRRPSAHLSRGERERVALARALVHQPALILADEPTASLDAQNADRVWNLLFDTCRESSATLVASTHEARALERFGRVVELPSLARAEA